MPTPAERIKLDRKSLREPDEFQTITGQVAAWARSNSTLLISVAVAASVVAVVAAGVSWYRARQTAAAAVRFQSAHRDFEAGRWAEAADAFAGLGRDYPGTSYGRLAPLYLGHAQARKPDAAAAAASYEEFLARSPAADYLRQQALIGLARARTVTGNVAGAREAYLEAAAIVGPFRTDARLSLARAYETAGEQEKAREMYREVLQDSPTASVRMLLEGKIPADVAATGAEAR